MFWGVDLDPSHNLTCYPEAKTRMENNFYSFCFVAAR